ncbi:hypothetical protein BJX99DRAFT_124995 [Aspergillus californicus]
MRTAIRCSTRLLALKSLVWRISSSFCIPKNVALRWNPEGTTHKGSFCHERDKERSVLLPAISDTGDVLSVDDGKYDCTGITKRQQVSTGLFDHYQR